MESQRRWRDAGSESNINHITISFLLIYYDQIGLYSISEVLAGIFWENNFLNWFVYHVKRTFTSFTPFTFNGISLIHTNSGRIPNLLIKSQQNPVPKILHRRLHRTHKRTRTPPSHLRIRILAQNLIRDGCHIQPTIPCIRRFRKPSWDTQAPGRGREIGQEVQGTGEAIVACEGEGVCRKWSVGKFEVVGRQ